MRDRAYQDLAGQTFGKLVVTEFAGRRGTGKAAAILWRCVCECGKTAVVLGGNLRNGNSKSCGCTTRSVEACRARATTHGMSKTPTYTSWNSMRMRVLNPDNHNFTKYGGRGISIDPRWDLFENFLTDMGVRPVGHTLDRIDVDGNYGPENCRWADPKTQGNNRRTNRLIKYQGETRTIAEWSRTAGLPHRVVYNRLVLYGWSPEAAFTTPVLRRK